MLSKRKIGPRPESDSDSDSDSDSQQLPLKRMRTRSQKRNDPKKFIESGENKPIAVIGAGIAGTLTALELAERGHEVVLLDREADMFQGTTPCGPMRMGLGFHYPGDVTTALQYLRDTINFKKQYREFFLGEGESPDHPMKHGRYVVPTEPVFSLDQVKKTYNAINDEYRRLCLEDPSNQVFGSPDKFLRILSPEEYKHDVVDLSRVQRVYETAEQLGDTSRFFSHIKGKIHRHPNINFFSKTAVQKVKRDEDRSFSLTVRFSDSHDASTIHVEEVVNCTWEESRQFDSPDAKQEAPQRTSRAKMLVRFNARRAPEHCYFFLTSTRAYKKGPFTRAHTKGPFDAMYSFAGMVRGKDGKMYIAAAATSGWHTNFAQGGPELTRKEAESLADTEKPGRKGDIVKAVSSVVRVEGAQELRSSVGIVYHEKRTKERRIDLLSPQSSHNYRKLDGCERKRDGAIVHLAPKIATATRGAKSAANLVENHLTSKGKVAVGLIARRVPGGSAGSSSDASEPPATPPRPRASSPSVRRASLSGSAPGASLPDPCASSSFSPPRSRSSTPSASPPGSPRPATPGYMRPGTPGYMRAGTPARLGASCLPPQLDLDASMEGSKLCRV